MDLRILGFFHIIIKYYYLRQKICFLKTPYLVLDQIITDSNVIMLNIILMIILAVHPHKYIL